MAIRRFWTTRQKVLQVIQGDIVLGEFRRGWFSKGRAHGTEAISYFSVMPSTVTGSASLPDTMKTGSVPGDGMFCGVTRMSVGTVTSFLAAKGVLLTGV